MKKVAIVALELPPDLTVDDLASLPDTGFRYELHEGNLCVRSPATMWHSRVGLRLTNALRAMGKAAYQEVGIKFGKRSSRTADIGIFEDVPDESQAFFDPADLAVVIEIVSPSSEDDDRIEKPRRYAQAGIVEYWRVERTADEESDAVIFRHKLARTADGAAVYVETDVTTLSKLESSAP